MSSYPSLGEYHAVIQQPRFVFKDPELASCRVEVDSFGMPRARSGGFAVTYRLSNGSHSWAVRCFNRDVPDREQRYAAISRFLRSSGSPAFVPFEYLPEGILVNGRRLPVVKMAWVEGETLGSYVNAQVRERTKIADLATAFRQTVAELDRLGVSHGDLQHGNVVVRNGQTVLVDYDGMYVPGMNFGRANELGHVNYQSPLRTDGDFNAELDRFSAAVIALGLEAVAIEPSLWSAHNTGDNLLFQRQDFIKPLQSRLLSDLRALPALRDRTRDFELLCRTPLSQLPTLHDFLGGTANISEERTIALPVGASVRLRQYDVLRAVDRALLLQREGQRIEIVGRVVGVAHKTTKYYKPFAMIDFGDWTHGHFRLMLWSEALAHFAAAGVDLDRYNGLWVSVTGLLEVYRPENFLARPQIAVTDPNEIRVLKGQAEAEQILKEAAEGYRVSQPRVGTGGRNQAIVDNLKRMSQSREANSAPSSSQAGSKLTSPKPARAAQVPATSQSSRNQKIAQGLAAEALSAIGQQPTSSPALSPGKPGRTTAGPSKPSSYATGKLDKPGRFPRWVILAAILIVLAGLILVR